ncbi:SUF system Fe-S cluster assembly protein [Nitrogeniibacter mangrovi]|uniref:SUF system Fe-S cluster assembly protein n=1 Tax=Nitrogeniibacter mangrovi TaxID=2016596 RepID=A0A6C1B1L9_9RHOO|nr:SUF system Fe-S cluster assembly protein [Nitrogeniibacter mangrovi]QID16164.1 SUF system Fe-S cluster assembly protein [Nitrogeniibacter mangrovi]
MTKFKWLSKRETREVESGAPERPLRERIIAALRQVHDPEIPINIYDLGLVYELHADETTGTVHLRMTLTAPGCPVAQTFPGVVERAVEAVDGVEEAQVELVWEPPWTPERMSEAARIHLGLV